MDLAINTNQYINGIPQNTVLLLLLFPVAVTLVSFLRQIVGLKSYNILTAILTAFAFFELGLGYGLILSITIYIIATLIRVFTRNLRLHYTPRMSLILTIVSFYTFFIIIMGKNIAPSTLKDPIFPLLLLITLADTYISTQIQKGLRTASYLFTETLLTAILVFFLISWDSLQKLVLNYPEISVLTILLNLVIGRWTGLKFTEYWRFRNILKTK